MPNLIQRLAGRTEDRTLTVQNVPSVMVQSSPAGAVTPTNATTIADVFACVRALSDAAASVPLIAYRRLPNGRERLEGGRIVDLLTTPAPGVSQANLIGTIVAHLNLHGNCYLGKFKTDGVVQQLVPLAPERVIPEIKGGRLIFTYTPTLGEQQTLTTADIVHLKAVSVDGLVGLSPVRQCRTALGLSSQLTEHAAYFFQNDARPSGILRVDPGVDKASFDQWTADWRAGHSGTANAHKIAILGGSAEFQAVTMPMDDAQFLEQRKLSAVECARIFRVPPWMIGADSGESMTYSNTESQALAFVKFSLQPWLTVIEQAISNDSDLCSQRAYVEFLLDSLLRADSATRADVYTKALNPDTGWMTREEVRRLENLDPEPARTGTEAAAALVNRTAEALLLDARAFASDNGHQPDYERTTHDH